MAHRYVDIRRALAVDQQNSRGDVERGVVAEAAGEGERGGGERRRRGHRLDPVLEQAKTQRLERAEVRDVKAGESAARREVDRRAADHAGADEIRVIAQDARDVIRIRGGEAE